MTLISYLEQNQIDNIIDAQEFMETEYNAIQTYCEICGYLITDVDLETIKSRGLEEDFADWKRTYVKDLWEDFSEIPMNPETECIEEEWHGFSAETHREEIWHWFEENFNISVAEDLIGLQDEKIMQKITDSQLLELPFGSKIKIIWHNSKHHEKNEEYYGVIFGEKIGYDDGLVDNRRDIAECIYNDWCMVYLMSNTL